jgi:hypothetical protein
MHLVAHKFCWDCRCLPPGPHKTLVAPKEPKFLYMLGSPTDASVALIRLNHDRPEVSEERWNKRWSEPISWDLKLTTPDGNSTLARCQDVAQMSPVLSSGLTELRPSPDPPLVLLLNDVVPRVLSSMIGSYYTGKVGCPPGDHAFVAG